MTTREPSRAKSSATARPMPEPPPVTTETVFARSMTILLSPFVQHSLHVAHGQERIFERLSGVVLLDDQPAGATGGGGGQDLVPAQDPLPGRKIAPFRSGSQVLQ